MKKLFSLVLILFSAYSVFGQCNCDETISSSIWNGGFTFRSNRTYCIKGDITIRYNVTFQDNTTICIPSGSTLKIDNTINGNAASRINVNIDGNFIVPNTFPVSFNLHVFKSGNIKGLNGDNQDIQMNGNTFHLVIEEGGNYKFGNLNLNNDGRENTIENHGTMTIDGEINTRNASSALRLDNYGTIDMTGNLYFSNSAGTNTFYNYGNLTCLGVYSTDPTLHMQNAGTMSMSQNYDNTEKSVFSNCGTFKMDGNWGFNLSGLIINTGNMLIPNSSIAFSSTGKIHNYSVMSLKQIDMDPNSLIYNEGEITFSEAPNTNIRFAGPGAGEQPEHSDSKNYGRFKWPGTQSNQSGWARGNLNFVTTTPNSVNDNSPNNSNGMFGQWNSINFDDSVRFGNCTSCTVITQYEQCANADGTWPAIRPSYDCIPVNRHVRTHL
ncbi:hypothetical protein [Zunongwangia pacifica]|uniref:Uncharacterized protein n=1 Tax=Zunongwangia pacifica TaxID=2911062 RepID=A0A9X1ZRB8_9FLAO|nr:hypothetical protein [Zunongwangia pacifica]MCL6217825.1 hypothetical protein [Zunongwangia pacifica]